MNFVPSNFLCIYTRVLLPKKNKNFMGSRSRDYLFTSFSVDIIPKYDPAEIVYLVYQLEKAPDTGRLHHQGFVIFHNGKSISAAQSVLGLNNCHLERRRGTRSEASAYCKKAESRVDGPYEFGECPEEKGQGRRTDLERACELLQEGKGIDAVIDSSPSCFVKFHRGLALLEARLGLGIRRGAHEPKVLVFVGPPGCGKTRSVYERFFSIYAKDPETIWWDGYSGQECVLFDDFYGGISYAQILRITDRYVCQVQTKGGHDYLRDSTTTFVFTSNKDPAFWWPLTPEIGAFQRRISGTTRWQGLDLPRQSYVPVELVRDWDNFNRQMREREEVFPASSESHLAAINDHF